MRRLGFMQSTAGALVVITAIAAVNSACGMLVEPCYRGAIGNTDAARTQSIAGAWRLVSVNGSALPYQIPLSNLSEGGVIIARGGGIVFTATDRYYHNNCKDLEIEHGTGTAVYRYTQAGATKPDGTASGTFKAQHDIDKIILSAVGKTYNASITRDASGRAVRITAVAPVTKWGIGIDFTLVFERGNAF